MIPGKYNMVCPQGTTFSKQLSCSSGGLPLDLTGSSVRMQVREKYSSVNPVLTLTTENGKITLGSQTGVISLLVDAQTTASLVAKQYVYDLEIVSNEVVTRLLEGKFVVTPEVTR